MAAKHIAIASTVTCILMPAGSVCRSQDDHVGTRAFAMVLAHNAVPCGVVAPEVVMAWRPGDPRREAVFAGEDPFGIALPSTLEDFSRRNGVFRATQVAGVVHLNSEYEPPEVTEALAREAPVDADIDAPAVALLLQATAAARGGELRGVAGSGPQPGPKSLLRRRVHLGKGLHSAVSILDEVVRQAPGVVWFATYNSGLPNQDLKLGLAEPDGTSVTLTVGP